MRGRRAAAAGIAIAALACGVALVASKDGAPDSGGSGASPPSPVVERRSDDPPRQFDVQAHRGGLGLITESTLEACGFTIEECERFSFRPTLLATPVAPRILGRARRSAVV